MAAPTDFLAAPKAVADDQGAPQFGGYAGALASMSLEHLRQPWQVRGLRRRFVHKKWGYAFIASDELAVFFACSHLGYAANAFIHVVDLETREVLADAGVVTSASRARVAEVGGEGYEATLSKGALSLSSSRSAGQASYAIRARVQGRGEVGAIELEASLEVAGAGPPLSVIAPVVGQRINVTQKWAGMRGAGELRCGKRTYALNRSVGGLDITNGYLSRHVVWRWAFASGLLADGTRMGFNLSEGFFDPASPITECGVWVDGSLKPLGNLQFQWNRKDVMQPWHVHGDGTALDFTPISVHHEARNLLLARSRFVQLAGHWSGVIAAGGASYRLHGVPGVAEDQDVVW